MLYGLYNEPFGENTITPFGFGLQGGLVPVGSGLLIMLVAGVGYAVLRGRRTVKNAAFCLMACTLTLAFTQCRKNPETLINNGETVHITLNMGGGRHIIEPGSGYVPVIYQAGDVIYVSNGGRYMGHSEYIEGETSYNCWLSNQCALVEFDFAEATNKKVKISNMLCEAKIDFTNHSITPTEKLDAITLYASDATKKWGILLLGAVERKSMGMVYNRTESYTYTGSDVDVEIYDYYKGVTVPELSTTNNFLYGADAVAVNNTESNKDNKVFVVSANANAVHFAPGNLKCTKRGQILDIYTSI